MEYREPNNDQQKGNLEHLSVATVLRRSDRLVVDVRLQRGGTSEWGSLMVIIGDDHTFSRTDRTAVLKNLQDLSSTEFDSKFNGLLTQGTLIQGGN